MFIEAVKVTIYINEADEWQGQPLHVEILKMLHADGMAGGTVLNAVAGFTGRGGVQTTSLSDAGAKLPLVIEFIDTAEHVERVLPVLKVMVQQRLITRQTLQIENGLG